MGCPRTWFIPPCPDIIPVDDTCEMWVEILFLHIARLKLSKEDLGLKGLTYSTEWSYVPRR